MLTPTSMFGFRLANTEFVPSISGEGSTSSVFRIQMPAEAIRGFPQLRDVLRFKNVLQLSGSDIGTAALTSLVSAPAKLVAVSTDDVSVDALAEFARRRGISEQLRIHPNVVMGDVHRLVQIAEYEFGVRRLEVVVDDVSDRMDTGERTFGALFPRLAPGGSYIFERWSWDHYCLEGFVGAMDGADEQKIEAATVAGVEGTLAEKGQIVESIVPKLVEAAQLRPDIVAGVTASRYWLEVRRGPTPVDPSGFQLPSPL